MKKNIALMAGGYSGEYVISIRSAEQIAQDIDPELYNVYLIIVERESWYCQVEGTRVEVDKNDFSLSLGEKKVRFDAAYITIHGTPGEDGLLQGYLDMMNVPYTTCNCAVSALTFDKSICNAVVRDFGIVNVAKNVMTCAENPLSNEEILAEVSLPVFVKPTSGGSSLGTFKVCDKSDLMPSIEKAFSVWHNVLVEEFIEGREFSCGALTVGKEVMALPVTEIVSQTEFFDYDAKYNGKSQELTPAPISEDLSQRIRQMTKQIYERLQCSGICRVDFIYNEKKDELFFLEVNTTPGQSAQSIVPQQVRAMGKDTKWLYNTVLAQLNLQ